MKNKNKDVDLKNIVLKSIELNKYSDPIEEEKKKERRKPSVERKNERDFSRLR